MPDLTKVFATISLIAWLLLLAPAVHLFRIPGKVARRFAIAGLGLTEAAALAALAATVAWYASRR